MRGLMLAMAIGTSAFAFNVSAALAGASAAPRSDAEARNVLTAPCAAEAPAPGAVFTGPVLQVIDGQTLCVAEGPRPDQWIRVRLQGANSTTSRGALMASSFAKDVICTAGRRDGHAVIARCRFNGDDLAALAATPSMRSAGEAWR